MRVTITTLHRITGVAESSWRRWLDDPACTLSVVEGSYHGGSATKRGRRRWLDLDEVHAFLKARGISEWNESHIPTATVDGLQAEVDALKRDLAALRQTIGLLQKPREPVTRTPDRVPPAPVRVLAPSPAPSAFPAARVAPRTRPLAQVSGLRAHPLYTQFWQTSARQAKEGRMLFQQFCKLFDVDKRNIDMLTIRDTQGRLPKNRRLSFTRVIDPGLGDNPTNLRYVDRAQREAWAAYLRHLGHLKKPYDEKIVQDALVELARLGER